MNPAFVTFRAGQRVDRARLPRVPIGELRSAVVEEIRAGQALVALFGVPDGDARADLVAVVGDESEGLLGAAAAGPLGSYPSFTTDCPAAHLFEREIFEQCGVRPEGHPWLKPVRFPPPAASARAGEGVESAPGAMEFFRVEGEEVHEVAVGPVHAGIIEPGHFRFQCIGEDVLHLEISLGYQHRGIERALAGGPGLRTPACMETLAGDTSIGHATAYAEVMDALSGSAVSGRAQALRAIALELERLANHAGDLGALANDVGFLPTASFCGRLRGDFLNMTALLCGNRFGRGWVRPGGVRFDLEPERAQELLRRLEKAESETAGAVNLLWETPSVSARFEYTGELSAAQAREVGLVGPAARACGIERDVRRDFPSGFYRFAGIPVSSMSTGDVFARAYVRWLEIQRSIRFIRETAGALPPGALESTSGAAVPDALGVSLVEGWRGRIAHVALTGPDGRFLRYKVVDPSFFNWFGLALAMRGQAISDFPLCNKSFNLSYCGHDL